jgi:hypothetical protein
LRRKWIGARFGRSATLSVFTGGVQNSTCLRSDGSDESQGVAEEVDRRNFGKICVSVMSGTHCLLKGDDAREKYALGRWTGGRFGWSKFLSLLLKYLEVRLVECEDGGNERAGEVWAGGPEENRVGLIFYLLVLEGSKCLLLVTEVMTK